MVPEWVYVQFDIIPFTRGRGLDVGCGQVKAYPHFIGVDNRKDDSIRRTNVIQPDIVADAEELGMFASNSIDFVFSSHLLEHIKEYEKALKEWWRVLKDGGYLVLYLPHKKLYPNVGEPGSNVDHQHDFMPDDIIYALEKIGGWDLVVSETRDKEPERSFFQVYKKLSHKAIHRFSCQEPKPEKTACVVRYGAFGDCLQAASVFPALKAEGYHTVLNTVPRGQQVVLHDPNIDEFLIQDRDQVPQERLLAWWHHLRSKYTKFVNLSGSVETTWLPDASHISFYWPSSVRKKMLNGNYLEHTHALAEVPYDKPRVKFYPTLQERNRAKMYAEKQGRPLIMWAMAGSAVHKVWPHMDTVIARILTTWNTATIVMAGDQSCKWLEAPWANEPRVKRTSGEWEIRDTLTLALECDVIVGAETGVLNAMSMEAMPKVVILSHSSHENLTRDWINTYALFSTQTPCYPCHQTHYDFTYCPRDELLGVAMCQAELPADAVWMAIERGVQDCSKFEHKLIHA